MRPKHYSLQKRALLIDNPSIAEFALEIPVSAIKHVLLRLPAAQGFRTGQPAELQQRLRTFMGRMRRWAESDWATFLDIWVGWAASIQGLETALQEYDNDGDFEDSEEGAEANSELDIRCFEHLMQASHEGKVTREQISKFYTFGYFLPNERIEQYIMAAKSEAELKLPVELDELKLRVQEVSDRGQATDKRIDVLKRELDRLGAVEERVLKVEKSVGEKARDIDQLEEKVGGTLQKALRSEIASIKSDTWSDIKKLLERTEQQLRSEHLQSTEQLERQMDATRELISQQIESLVRGMELRFSDLEGRLSQVTSQAPVHQGVGSFELRASIKTERVPSPDAGRVLEEQSEAEKALSENLRGIGVQSKDAHVLAAEILASLMAGQVVMLKGSTAPLVATVCARTLACENTYRVRVPVGLLDGRDLGACLDEIIPEEERTDRVAALILEGFNHSAPEVYATRLRSLVSDRLFGLDTEGRGLLVFATVTDGPGALPLSPEICEIGPVFHVDCLTWRDKWPKRPLVAGAVTEELWAGWTNPPTEDPLQWDDLLAECQRLSSDIPVLWRRCLNTAAMHLALLPEDESMPTFLQSLAFGWLLPRAIAQGIYLEGFEDGLLDGTEPDRRIALLLGTSIEGESD